MPAGWRERRDRASRAMTEHKVTSTVFGISLTAILAVGIVAGVSSTRTTNEAVPGAGTSSAEYAIGQKAPAFDLAALGNPGAHVSMAAYAGEAVIVNFFASWCGPCRKETPLMARYYTSAHSTVRVIGVDASDSRAAALTFTKRYGVTYPVGSDPAATTAGAFGVTGLPQTFFLNTKHKIVDRVYGAVTQAALAKGVKLMGQPSAAGAG